jgi:hypothetical protein
VQRFAFRRHRNRSVSGTQPRQRIDLDKFDLGQLLLRSSRGQGILKTCRAEAPMLAAYQIPFSVSEHGRRLEHERRGSFRAEETDSRQEGKLLRNPNKSSKSSAQHLAIVRPLASDLAFSYLRTTTKYSMTGLEEQYHKTP